MSALNWEHILSDFAHDDEPASVPIASPRDPVLVARLPPTSVLQSDAERVAKRSYTQALLDESLATQLETNAVLEKVKAATSSPPLASQVFSAKLNSSPSVQPHRKVAFWCARL
jgi:hypothetical protein